MTLEVISIVNRISAVGFDKPAYWYYTTDSDGLAFPCPFYTA